ncbi:uncharacterized protein N7482_010027 [Penicillium canariense]|uniref:Xylanolytic transcriptional activator regulatory domain-containing protein n=1 Tax=Penicillium canariense TaxID=189055 RepID=A0A9W9LG91_9EURO|nr:uncharacterized protein N7482_010027 [Penicillium canariense]KAJ5153549.1 hypothetical protein N7482_010027 [Penicillium canariense]
MILDTVLRMEASIEELKSLAATASGSNIICGIQAKSMSPTGTVTSMSQEASHHPGGCTIRDPTESAVLSSGHLSSAESLLKWPVFLDHPSILEETESSLLLLEHRRSSFRSKPYAMVPSVDLSEVKSIVSVFQQTYNFWFPTISLDDLNSLELRIHQQNLDPSCQSCLALLVMSLGCVGASVIDEGGSKYPSRQLKLQGELWFTAAMKMLHLAHIEISVQACQCLLLTALYFCYLQRPLQTWSYVNSARTRCRFLLSCPFDNPERDDREHITRIFWSCFVLESNYISELPTLPQHCNAEIESILSLPGKFQSHEAIEEEERSTFYFLASIALRRLLNRAHYVLYDHKNGLQIDSNYFPSVNQELACQLQDWYQTLPPSLQFPEDGKSADDPHSEYLRQWYLSCRSVIYRPYLEWALANPSWNLNNNLRMLNGCQVALDTCLFKLRYLKQVPYTVMVDTWPCSLSDFFVRIATAMLTLMGGFCHPQLTIQLRRIALLELGPRLEQFLQEWMTIHESCISPGIEKALRLIMKVHEFFESECAKTISSQEDEQHFSTYAFRVSQE